MRGLKGKRIIVASGATGIGASVAKRLGEEGARLIVGDINEAGAESTANTIREAGGMAKSQVFDLADRASIDRLVNACVEAFGGIDGLANIGADTDTSAREIGKDIFDIEVDHWERTLRVNLIGHMLTIRAAIPHIVNSGGGAIVSISSGAAFIGMATMPAYSSSKAALHPLIRHVAKRWGKGGVRCNGIAPGWVMSERARSRRRSAKEWEEILNGIALSRVGEPEDIAAMTAFLLSDDAAWVTGQVISVNGGGWFRD
jgi:NAD(P)-dependent dehydrogenase (short-subunit alcohol dehydrogenase family)